MGTQKYCVYNQTRESFLSLGVTQAETPGDGKTALVQAPHVAAGAGLWMTTVHGSPEGDDQAAFDLLFLDKDHRILQQVESFPVTKTDPVDWEAASALALPPHTIYSSQTQIGDQLVICVAEEMGKHFRPLAQNVGSTVPLSATKQPISGAGMANETEGSGTATSAARSQQMKRALERLDERERAEEEAEDEGRKVSVFGKFFRWLSSDRRRSRRHPLPGLVAYYWTGGAPQAFHIGNISSYGLFLLTEERWFPGTLIQMTLQRVDTSGEDPGDTIAVHSKVVRWDDDGVGLSFLHSRLGEGRHGKDLAEYGADKKSLDAFILSLNLNGAEGDHRSRR